MRGWHYNSREHALAARGISCRARGIHNVCGVVDVESDEIVEALWGKDLGGRTREEFVEELIEDLEEICSKPTTKLYRVVWTKKFDRKHPGLYYVARYEDLFDGSDFLNYLYELGIEQETIPEDADIKKDMKIIEVEVPTKDIDIKMTVNNWFEWPEEREIVLAKDSNVKIIGVEEPYA